MMNPERSSLIEFLRGELVGPIRSAKSAQGRKRYEVKGAGPVEPYPAKREDYNAWLYWKPEGQDGDEEEILSIRGGSNPHRAYGIGLLHPEPHGNVEADAEDGEEENGDKVKDNTDEDDNQQDPVPSRGDAETADGEGQSDSPSEVAQNSAAQDDDLEVTNDDSRRPSSMAISFCVRIEAGSTLVVSIPRSRKFSWQGNDQAPFPLNGIYERFQLRLERKEGQDADPTVSAYRRRAAVAKDAEVRFTPWDLNGASRSHDVPLALGVRSDLILQIQVYSRPHPFDSRAKLLTVVMRNRSAKDDRDLTLFQSCFEVRIEGGELLPYPENVRPPERMDADEQSLELLYRDTRCWGIGHGCAAAWDGEDREGPPKVLVAEVMPAVELPSMTPDIELDGQPLRVSMSELAALPEPESDDAGAWSMLNSLVDGYDAWIQSKADEIGQLTERLRDVGVRHLGKCRHACERMRYGLTLLRSNDDVRQAFRWTNEAMLLQQIAMKQILHRKVGWNAGLQCVEPLGEYTDPFKIKQEQRVKANLGNWRAFQIAFLLMSLRGVVEPSSEDRELVDIVWFPTGGGKTEAYLAVAAFQMFYQRLLAAGDAAGAPRRDGTNVLMRYTLRMLTTDQFQRAASLVCAMEAIRRRERGERIPGSPFRLGLWLGSGGSPNHVDQARQAIGWFKENDRRAPGNPLVLTECPWCRTAIGRVETRNNEFQLAGIIRDQAMMRCPDQSCLFHDDHDGLPVEVVDDRIYERRPSLVIATADKFAMLAYEPMAGSLFGRERQGQGQGVRTAQTFLPPSLIIQDELHLISGPLGTLFGLYETAIAGLCTFVDRNRERRPKIMASTATVRGADDQVRALFARDRTALFPPPGLDIADSFFGRYARSPNGTLLPGRLYVGIHALYGSMQTTTARAFAAVLARAQTFADDKKDPWWTLLAYYNSMRELAGSRLLIDSDIPSRMKHLAEREGMRRRYLRPEELSSRLSQAQIVELKDRLSESVVDGAEKSRVDVCLSSNIVEVGVDIDRLSLMAVVGQPKSTASYIQATGRVGRRWWERPGLILTLLNPFKSRDTSHFEQFHTYHRRLYERVEPTSATPFSLSAIQRGLVGAIIAWIRQQVPENNSPEYARYVDALNSALELFKRRCESIGMGEEDTDRSLAEMKDHFCQFVREWRFFKPAVWSDWNQSAASRPLMLIPGKYATPKQRDEGFVVPTSLRDVDTQAVLTLGYFQEDHP